PSLPESGGCGGCFCVDQGEGFAVTVSGPVTIPILDATDDPGTISLESLGTPFPTGLNYISLPYQRSLIMAQDVCDAFGVLNPPQPGTNPKLDSVDTCSGNVTSRHYCGNLGPYALPSACHALIWTELGSRSYANPVTLGTPVYPACISQL